ncbi:MAG: aldehyde dehydrogenase family protein [Bryobacteraceae bacterium]
MLEDKDLISVQEVRCKVAKAYEAWQRYRTYTQDQVDAIVEHAAAAARQNACRLAELAVEETGYGNARDKLAKNLLCCDLLPRKMRGMKTVGVIRELPEERMVEIAVPVGVVAAILPTTNPTSTAIYKSLIALKAGNAIVLSPHPNAKRCTCETADVVYRAALEAGAPEDIVQCIAVPSLEGTSALMRHERTGVILSTGGHGIVKAAYSSGKPAFGVGPGNVPVLIDASADIADAIAKVVEGKSFDFGTLCSSEQSVVAEHSLRESILAELKSRQAHICDAGQKEALARLLFTRNFTVNPQCVGQPANRIAEMAGFSVPPGTPILAAEIEGVGKQYPLSAEKLSPVLSLLFVKDFTAAVETCRGILRFGGLGHTCVIYSQDDARIRHYALEMPSMRVLVNTPAPQGSTGITTNVFPAMTLGCGAMAGNITSDNIGPQHLMNIKRLAYAVRKPEEAFTIPPDAARTRTPDKPAAVSKADIGSAVARYLAKRGIGMAGPEIANPAAQAVDRFLAKRTAAPASSRPSAAPSPPPDPPPVPVDFVCENDVRQAMQTARKIHIHRKTIVTPAARDLAAQSDILVEP